MPALTIRGLAQAPGLSSGRAARAPACPTLPARTGQQLLQPRPTHGRVAPRSLSALSSTTPRLLSGDDGSNGDADPELWAVLDLCDDGELEAVHGILYGTSLLSPIVKSLAADNEPAAAAVRGRAALMRRIDGRFRFLAADAGDAVAGRWPTYREALLRLRDRLGVPCPGGLATADLEAEILLHALADAGEEAPKGGAVEVEEGLVSVREGGRAFPATTTPTFAAATASTETADERRARHAARRTRVAAARALRLPRLALDALGGAMQTAAKVGGAAALGRAGGAAVRALAGSAAGRRAGHEAALAALHRAATTGGAAAARRAAAVRTAQASASAAAARYGLARGALAAASWASWALLAADLAVKAVGTDYARLSRAVVALAQVRLVRTYGWEHGGGGVGGGGPPGGLPLGRPPAADA